MVEMVVVELVGLYVHQIMESNAAMHFSSSTSIRNNIMNMIILRIQISII